MDISDSQVGELINSYNRWANIPNHYWDEIEKRWLPYEIA